MIRSVTTGDRRASTHKEAIEVVEVIAHLIAIERVPPLGFVADLRVAHMGDGTYRPP